MKGVICFEFTEQEMAMFLNCSRCSVNKIKNELKEYELLEGKDIGSDVTTSKRKSFWYLCELNTKN